MPQPSVGGAIQKVLHVTDFGKLEITAALYALQSFCKQNFNNTRILLRIDNKAVISYINRGGSVKFSKLNKITQELWTWCETKNISVFASYIPSSENREEADLESRRFSIETEYELNYNVFQEIVRAFGTPEIDLFATKLNRKCEKFISWFPDPMLVQLD